MKSVFTAVLLLVSWVTFAQADSAALKKAVQELDRAFVEKDSASLNRLLDKKLSYGHSNGWIQNKAESWNDMASGKLVYTKIESTDWQLVSIDKDFAVLRMNTKAEGTNGGQAFSLTLHVMQVWKNDRKGWQLLGRQAARI